MVNMQKRAETISKQVEIGRKTSQTVTKQKQIATDKK